MKMPQTLAPNPSNASNKTVQTYLPKIIIKIVTILNKFSLRFVTNLSNSTEILGNDLKNSNSRGQNVMSSCVHTGSQEDIQVRKAEL